MDILLILNGPPYGTERCYNALRLADDLVKQEDVHLTVFLMGDAVFFRQGRPGERHRAITTSSVSLSPSYGKAR